MMNYRTIIHLDLDAFFCAVEENNNPQLRGKPFAVGGLPRDRGVVASCSYAARRSGVRSAMPMAQAIRKCQGLIIIPPHFKDYHQASRKVMDFLSGITSLVEQVSIDEAFLDVSDLTDSGESLARKLQNYIRDELELPCSLGVATNKLVAKIATDAGKKAIHSSGPPNAIQIVPPGQEASFLAPLPTQALWGVGPKTAARLEEMGIHTIGEIANQPIELLMKKFGKHGKDLALAAKGIDDNPLVTSHEIKSLSQETTFSRDISDREALRKTIVSLSDEVGDRLRMSHLGGTTIRLKLRLANFTTLTRQVTLVHPTDDNEEICDNIMRLFESVWQPNQPVRLLGVGVSKLTPAVNQLKLWGNE